MDNNTKEQVYDSRIQPLIEEMASIAKEHDISIVFAADIGRDEFERPQVASTILLFDGCHKTFWDMKRVLCDGHRVVAPPVEETYPDDFIINQTEGFKDK